MEQQIPLAGAASEHHLYGVHAAGVVLGDAYGLLIPGMLQLQQLHGVQRRLEADGQPAALMPVEGNAPGPCFFFVHFISSSFFQIIT